MATGRLEELIRLNHNGTIKTKLDPSDKYGPALGWLTLGGLDINRTLVEEGLALEIKA